MKSTNRIEFQTFKEFGTYYLREMTDKEPSCFNSTVRVQQFKVTIEPIEESKEVYQERLQKLWDECDNHHHWLPLESKAKELGVELKGRAGSKRNTR